MITFREAAQSLYGGYRLARFDPAGLGFMNASLQGFWNSFFAAVIVLPLFLVMLVVDFLMDRSDDLFRFTAVQAIGYVIGWVLFPLVMIGVVRALDREPRYLGYIVAYNWCAVVQNAFYTPAALLVASSEPGLTPAGLLAIVVLAFVMVYLWFVTRVALDVPGRLAAMVVMIDVFLSIFLSNVTDTLIGGRPNIQPTDAPASVSMPAQTLSP